MLGEGEGAMVELVECWESGGDFSCVAGIAYKGNGGFVVDDWEEPKNWALIRHKLLCNSGFSEAKLKFAIGKAHVQFYGKRFLGKRGYKVVGSPFERVTDVAFKLMR